MSRVEPVKRRRRGRPIETVIPPYTGTVVLQRNTPPTMEGVRIKCTYSLYEVLLLDTDKGEMYVELQWATTKEIASLYAIKRVNQEGILTVAYVGRVAEEFPSQRMRYSTAVHSAEGWKLVEDHYPQYKVETV